MDFNTRRATAGALVAVMAAVISGCTSSPTNAPVAQTSATAPTVPTTPAASPSPADFSTFTGQWIGHGNDMTVAADGTFTMEERTYNDCSQNPPPCDEMTNSVITDGAVAHGALQSVSGTTATGVISTTTDPSLLPVGSVTFNLDTTNDVINALNVNWCGPSAPAGICY